jgi:BioD-like phosphotransacetylase family protein
MTALYVTSWREGAGKTALCVGIGRWLQRSGKKVTYLKPILPEGQDGDAKFVMQALGLGKPGESLTPLYLGQQEIKAELNSGRLSDRVKQAYGKIATGKDIVLLEEPAGLSMDTELAEASYRVAEAVDARVVIVAAHSNNLPWEKLASAGKRFGQRFLGLVISQVPQKKVEAVRDEASSQLSRENIRVLGILPEDRSLMGISVAEIAEALQAKTLCCQEGMTELVENLMIGAMTPDSGADYFSRKDNKAAIVRGKRPDMQLAALATSTKCLILTGGVEPPGQVLSWAEEKGVPVLLTERGTLSTVAEAEQAFVRARFRQKGKLEKLDKVLEQGFDFSSLGRGLGLDVAS